MNSYNKKPTLPEWVFNKIELLYHINHYVCLNSLLISPWEFILDHFHGMWDNSHLEDWIYRKYIELIIPYKNKLNTKPTPIDE